MTNEAIEAERKKFEAKFSDLNLKRGLVFGGLVTQSYRMEHTRFAWYGWQARAQQDSCLVEQLPTNAVIAALEASLEFRKQKGVDRIEPDSSGGIASEMVQVVYRAIRPFLLDRLPAQQDTVNVELLAALRYARRFLKPLDHDVEYVDAAIARGEQSQSN